MTVVGLVSNRMNTSRIEVRDDNNESYAESPKRNPQSNTTKVTPFKPKKLIKTRFKENISKKKSMLNSSVNSPAKRSSTKKLEIKSRNGPVLAHSSSVFESKEKPYRNKQILNKFNIQYLSILII
jgi:hypothetical protein